MMSLFVSCSKGLEYLLAEELVQHGFIVTSISPHGVYGETTLEGMYRLCLWLRIANRVQLILFKGQALDQNALYKLCHEFAWDKIFSVDKTIAIEFHGTSTAIRNSMFGAQVVKDAVVDYFRDLTQVRPTIDKITPQIRLHAHLKHDAVTVSLDLTGYSLHQRGYRLDVGAAPLKENLASALLVRAKWPELMHNNFAFHDPFCGSGTLVIEAAMMAANIAPGLLRTDQAFQNWHDHNHELWLRVREDAFHKRMPLKTPLYGTDSDERVIVQAEANAKRAGVADWVIFSTKTVQNARPLGASSAEKGLLICNPPYGERLSDPTQLSPLYQQLGQVLHEHYQGWEACVFTSNEMLAKAIGLRAKKQYTLYNGALPCKLYCISLDAPQTLRDPNYKSRSESAQMFVNRLKKNFDHYRKWAKRNQISCYRVYDADIPEYAFAIDIYGDYAVLQEYAAPATISTYLAEKRSSAVAQETPGVLGFPESHIILKQRKQQKGLEQYQKLDKTDNFLTIQEGSVQLKVNLHDYLDTGLFLDHRLLRLKFAQLKPGTRFLNCFCYTASASVHAAYAGALTTNVDLSATYLAWARDNFRLNRLPESKHQFVQYDCLEWLRVTRDQFDVIFLDPPSFSNSKRMHETLDIQRDHESLIQNTMRLLATDGILYFSTNFRAFKLAPALNELYKIEDISAQTIDVDFKRNQRIHQCFKITH